MPQLQIRDQGELAADVGGEFPACYHVNMTCYGYSAGPPLFTWGALPCMNVVIHNRAGKGCLAHVWNSSTDGAELYNLALTVVTKLLQVAGNPAAADIYLFAGQAFVADSGFHLTHKQPRDVDVYLRHHLGSNHSYMNFLHHAMGQVLYWPARHVVYFLSDSERVALQKTMIEFSNLGKLSQLVTPVKVGKY